MYIFIGKQRREASEQKTLTALWFNLWLDFAVCFFGCVVPRWWLCTSSSFYFKCLCLCWPCVHSLASLFFLFLLDPVCCAPARLVSSHTRT